MNMMSPRSTFRSGIKCLLSTSGLLPIVRQVRKRFAPKSPEEHERYQRFLRYKQQFGHILQCKLNTANHQKKNVLVSGVGYPLVEAELGLMKALELEGFNSIVVIHKSASLDLKYYKLIGSQIIFWDDFLGPLDIEESEAIVNRCQSSQDLGKFNYEGARVGLIAVSTVLRGCRLGFIDITLSQQRQGLVKALAISMRYARAAKKILKAIHPEYALFVDGVYTPDGELVDVCLTNNINAISWNAAHKNNTLMLKRYTSANREGDLASLSDESWHFLRTMEWTDEHRDQLDRELCQTYTTGGWFSACGVQFNKRMLDAATVSKEIGLDSSKKTAFIFPSILWDSSLNRGEDLFRDYEEWLIETVRVACANDRVNWVIKIHPAHVGKAVQEGFLGDPAEVIILRKYIGKLPSHVHFIPADSSISTLSLFAVMDYCLTVRGTIGLESARLGIPTLTAGSGRYAHRGFTLDSDSREDFLEKVAHIQEIPPLSPSQRELAERFAYGLFMLRPLPLKTISVEYNNTKTYVGDYRINIKSKEDWYKAGDLRAFSRWMVQSKASDFLHLSGPQIAGEGHSFCLGSFFEPKMSLERT
jgi:hypothetical protein